MAAKQPVIMWDFDRTLGYRFGMWSQALVDVALAHDPACGLTVDAIRPWLRTGFPWHQPFISHTHLVTAESWWAPVESQLAMAYRKNGFALEKARYLAHKAHLRYIDPQTWCLYDDTLPTLNLLSQRGWMHVILSNHVPELPSIIEALGLCPLLTAQFISATTGFEKPHPQAYQLALAHLDNPDVVSMVGDNM